MPPKPREVPQEYEAMQLIQQNDSKEDGTKQEKHIQISELEVKQKSNMMHHEMNRIQK